MDDDAITLVPGTVSNHGKPILLAEVNLIGVAAESVQGGGEAKIWTRLTLTSDDPGFQMIAENLTSALSHLAHQAGTLVDLSRANCIVLVVRPDKQAELWIDGAATCLQMMLKRSVAALAPVFETDIADVIGMWFPALSIDRSDRLLVLFRENWGFGLFFDLAPDGELDIEHSQQELGRLYRRLKFRQLYGVLANNHVFDRLVAAGWFPFVELLGSEFQELVNHCSNGFAMDEIEAKLVANFDDVRLDHMVARWEIKANLKDKMPLLREAVRYFKAREPIASIKIAITEIEGVLRAEAPAPSPAGRLSMKNLLKHAIDSAIKRSGGPDTLLLPEAFALYLREYTFAQFDPSQGMGQAGSRHAVGHGAAAADSYTDARALQALLTIDQLAFYT
jgi:hypothetical protein